MSLRFSNDGPEFPNEFVDSLLAGDMVFLCGAGVSAPQMPDFGRLVESTYETLEVERTDSEKSAFEKDLFEEVLGSLSRQLADPYAVVRTVSELLAVPDHPSLSQHRTIVRLSHDLDNRISVVTTNFDTLLERAAAEVMPSETARDISFAGQALPAPGSPSFSGIIHIHGRLADIPLGLERTPLVLMSADYGDAYMRSGWASRFLFDLARCKTIVLVGYGARDAPVRYFLNVLEADRARFPDLKQVYALAAYERNPEEARHSWGTLAVEPLPYCKVNPDCGKHDHSTLWRDLAELADIAARPKHSRKTWARAILERPVTEANDVSRKALDWLFGGRRDLWPEAIKAITDPAWFKVFQEEDLWTTEDATWVIAAWVARNPQDQDRLECACEWQERLRRPFTEEIEQRVLRAEGLDEIWLRVWRLFCLVEPVLRSDTACYEMQRRLASGVVLHSDLQKAVSLLAPRLEIGRRGDPEVSENAGSQPTSVGEIVWAHMASSDPHGAGELVDALCKMRPRARQILDLATAELQSSLELEAELELIGEEREVNDSAVPSIEQHAQNEHQEGVIFLVRVLAESLNQAKALDLDYTKGVASGWKNLPGRVGLRLCLHAMRDAELFDADEAMSTLLEVSDTDFWTIRREIALLLKDRARTASPMLVNQVEERILQIGDAYYDRYTVEPGEVDWRAHARDATVWLRLNMLQAAGVLSKIGAAELSTITERHDYLNRDVEDRDFFEIYSTAGRYIAGDPAPIIEASEDDRLQVAQKLAKSPDLDLRGGWSVFCRSHPRGAFDSLCKGEVTAANGALWDDFLHGLASDDEASKEIRDDLSVQAFDHLSQIDTDILRPMVSGLSDLICSEPRQRFADLDGWLERLWKIVSERPGQLLDLSSDLYDKAINSIAGRLTETLLLEMDARRKQASASSEALRQLIRSIATHEGPAGQLGRAVLTRNASFLLAIERNCVIDILGPRISASDKEGAALRAVMLSTGSISPDLTQLLGEVVKKGAIESGQSDRATTIAANVLRPAVADIRGDHSVRWGLTASDVAHVLREAPQEIRRGALEVLAIWLRDDPAGVEEAWCAMIIPFFKKVWPKEHKFRDVSLTPHLIDLAVGSGDQFPTAVEFLHPYLSPYDRGYGSLRSIDKSEVPEKFPRETLNLLWLVCGPKSRGSFYEISKIIDRLIDADPDIEDNRSLQWLEQHAERFE